VAALDFLAGIGQGYIPGIKAIRDSPDLRLDGFIGPGHVSTVIGCRPYEFIPRDYGKPLVVAGFEPLDLLQSVYLLLDPLGQGRCEVANQYTRVAPWDGNPLALRVVQQVMELRPHFEWRGLGFIPHSGLRLREEYARFDTERRLALPGIRVADTVDGARLAFTTDSFVVSPLFFPGGDIGDLAVNGTVNDLAVAGADPLYLAAGVALVSGDTKVVQPGRGTAATSPPPGSGRP
jgi:hypothetical protein